MDAVRWWDGVYLDIWEVHDLRRADNIPLCYFSTMRVGRRMFVEDAQC